MVSIPDFLLGGAGPVEMAGIDRSSRLANEDPTEKLSACAVEHDSNALPRMGLLWLVHGLDAIAVPGHVGRWWRPDVPHDLRVGVEIEQQLRIGLIDVAKDKAIRLKWVSHSSPSKKLCYCQRPPSPGMLPFTSLPPEMKILTQTSRDMAARSSGRRISVPFQWGDDYNPANLSRLHRR
jgi:hypothetical protein